jgi:FAD-dependent monooxygenase
LEPWQRVSQEVFEAWLKILGDENPLINLRFGWKVQNVKELDENVEVTAVNVDTGAEKIITSRFAVGCDGASSTVRKDIGIEVEGGQM